MRGSVNVEFIISVFVFLTTISFITITIINNIPAFRYISISEINNAKAYAISEILLFDEGYPSTGLTWWDVSRGYTNVADIQRIGLSSGKKYFLSRDKILALNNICNNNNFIRNVFDADVVIEITDDAGNFLVQCPKRKSITLSEFAFTRFGIYDINGNNVFDSDDEIIKIKVGTYV